MKLINLDNGICVMYQVTAKYSDNPHIAIQSNYHRSSDTPRPQLSSHYVTDYTELNEIYTLVKARASALSTQNTDRIALDVQRTVRVEEINQHKKALLAKLEEQKKANQVEEVVTNELFAITAEAHELRSLVEKELPIIKKSQDTLDTMDTFLHAVEGIHMGEITLIGGMPFGKIV